MTKSGLFSVALVASLFISGAAMADQPGADWMPKNQVVKQMEAQGYSGVLIEADDGRWEGLAIKDGGIVKFHADPRTGAITKSVPKRLD